MFTKFFLFIAIIMISIPAFTQTEQEGNVKIVQDNRVDKVLDLHKQFKTDHPEIDGFKIQIFMDSGNDAVEKANAVVENFTINFPDTPVELTYGAPYYRVRAGNFRTRVEAEGVLKNILPYFSQAFIIKDKIKP
ncbi:MAG: SPOR domain-containing protein [Bacteroidales bacterium]